MKEKKVTNLELKICKARDILESRDLDTIYTNLNLFMQIELEINKHVNKYTKGEHNLSFTYQDLKALSDEAFKFIENYQQKFLFDRYAKEIRKFDVIDDKVVEEKINKDFVKNCKVDTVLRMFYKDLSYLALVVWIWSCTNEKKSIDVLLLDTLKQFAK